MKIIILIALLLTACASNVKSPIYSNPKHKVGSQQERNEFNKHSGECKMQAYETVPPPRQAQSQQPKVNSPAPSLSSISDGYEAARAANAPREQYNRNLESFFSACLNSKGWVVIGYQ